MSERCWAIGDQIHNIVVSGCAVTAAIGGGIYGDPLVLPFFTAPAGYLIGEVAVRFVVDSCDIMEVFGIL